jgi:hypothetical protein
VLCLDVHVQVIGRVGGLTLLNGADVKPRERRDCELRYLQNVLAEQAEARAAAGGQEQHNVAGQHPRLPELKAKYGQVRWVYPSWGWDRAYDSSSVCCSAAVQPYLSYCAAAASFGAVAVMPAGNASNYIYCLLAQLQKPLLTFDPHCLCTCSAVALVNPAKQQGSTLSSTTCELLLCCSGAAVKKKLPKSVTVAALRLLCARLFKLAPDQIQLLLQTADAAGPLDDDVSNSVARGEDIGQDDTKQLSYWDVSDGCSVQVVHVDPDQQRQQREAQHLAESQQHEERMAQQLQQGEALRSAADA